MKHMDKSELEKELKNWKPNCYCKEENKFCGTCEECGKPGHIQHCPLSIPYIGWWCDDCVKEIMRLDNEGKTAKHQKQFFQLLKRIQKKLTRIRPKFAKLL